MENFDLNMLLVCIALLGISSYLPMQIAGLNKAKKLKKK